MTSLYQHAFGCMQSWFTLLRYTFSSTCKQGDREQVIAVGQVFSRNTYTSMQRSQQYLLMVFNGDCHEQQRQYCDEQIVNVYLQGHDWGSCLFTISLAGKSNPTSNDKSVVPVASNGPKNPKGVPTKAACCSLKTYCLHSYLDMRFTSA